MVLQGRAGRISSFLLVLSAVVRIRHFFWTCATSFPAEGYSAYAVILPLRHLAGECYEAARAPRLKMYTTDSCIFRDAKVISRRYPFVGLRFVSFHRISSRCRDSGGQGQKAEAGSFTQGAADYRTQCRRSNSSCVEPSCLWPAAW